MGYTYTVKIVWPWVKGIDSLTFNVSNPPYRGKLPVSSRGCFGVPFGGTKLPTTSQSSKDVVILG